MSITVEAQARIQELRQKSLAGTITTDEMKEAIALMREDRVRAATSSAKSRAAKAPTRSAEDMLSELEGGL